MGIDDVRRLARRVSRMNAAPPESNVERSLCFVDSTHAPWGAEESLLVLAETLHQQGVTTSLVCRSPDLAQSWVARVANSASLRQALVRRGRAQRLLDSFWLARNFREIARHSDVVIFSYHLIAAAVILRWLLRGRFTLTLDLHDYILPGRGRSLLRRFVRSIDSVIAVSRFAATPVSGVGSPVTVLYRPVSLRPEHVAEPRRRGRDEELIVGIIGRLEASKQHEVAIRAVAQASDIPVTAIIRGNAREEDSDYELKLRRLIQELAPDRVALEGRVATEAAYLGLHAVIIANESEAMGRTVAEGQMHGLAVIVPDAGGASELVEADKTGLVFAAGSSLSLADCLRSLSEDEERRLRICKSAVEVATQRHEPQRYARAYLAAIRPRIG